MTLPDRLEELLPCPFCGHTASIIEAHGAGPQAYVVQCDYVLCMASSKLIYALKDDVAPQLTEAWNTRAAQSARIPEDLDNDIATLEVYASNFERMGQYGSRDDINEVISNIRTRAALTDGKQR